MSKLQKLLSLIIVCIVMFILSNQCNATEETKAALQQRHFDFIKECLQHTSNSGMYRDWSERTSEGHFEYCTHLAIKFYKELDAAEKNKNSLIDDED